MIYFFCSECREELEAEDSIKGSRMKCPACLKDIEVPQIGVKAPTTRSTVPKDRDRDREGGEAAETHPGSRFILLVLLLGLVGLLIVGGVGYTLLKRERERAERARPKCATCSATGRVPCAACSGSKTRACRVCSGTGKRKNFRDQEEDCFACAGKSVVDCVVCGGRGGYTCTACGGTGHLDEPARPSGGKSQIPNPKSQ